MKRKQVEKEQVAEKEPDLQLDEWPDFEALQQLCELHLPEQLARNLLLYRKRLKKKNVSERISTKYFVNSCKYEAGGASISNTTGWVRRALAWRHYHKLHFKNLEVTLLLHLLDEIHVDVPDSVAKMLLRPDEFYEEYGMSDKQGRRFRRDIINAIAPDDTLAPQLCKDMKRIASEFQNCFEEDYEQFVSNITGERKNLARRFMAEVIADAKCKCLEGLIAYIQRDQEKGKIQGAVGVITKKGLMMERETPFTGSVAPNLPLEFFTEAQAFVKQVTEGYDIIIEEVPMTPSAEEVKLFQGPRVLKMMPSDKHRVTYLLCEAGKGKRRQGLFTMKPHATVPKCFSQDQEAEVFINAALKSHPNLIWKMKDALEWFTSIEHEVFPILKDNREVIGFADCVLTLATNTTQPWSQFNGDCTHFFTKTYPTELEIQTGMENWNKLVKYQQTEEGYRMLHIMMGRIFHPLGADNWQVILFLLGDANTGKSTIMQILMAMFPSGSVGIISGNQETTFGFQTAYKKRAILVMDMPLNFHEKVEQTMIQSMISGEMVSIPVKRFDAIDILWKVPFCMSGTQLPKYKDLNGSIKRRIFWLPFKKLVKNSERNTELKNVIIRDELHIVLAHCLNEYHKMRIQAFGQDFWSFVAGPEFDTVQEMTAAETSTLDQFLCDGNRQKIPTFEKGKFVQLSDFQEQYNIFMDDRKLKRERIVDYSKLKEREFVMNELRMCSKCNKPAIRTECQCEKPSRTSRTIIENMVLSDPPFVLETDKDFGKLLARVKKEEHKELLIKIKAHHVKMESASQPVRQNMADILVASGKLDAMQTDNSQLEEFAEFSQVI